MSLLEAVAGSAAGAVMAFAGNAATVGVLARCCSANTATTATLAATAAPAIGRHQRGACCGNL